MLSRTMGSNQLDRWANPLARQDQLKRWAHHTGLILATSDLKTDRPLLDDLHCDTLTAIYTTKRWRSYIVHHPQPPMHLELESDVWHGASSGVDRRGEA